MPLSSIALQIARNSQGWPMHILKPAGLPPESLRMLATKAIISSGVENARCVAGEMQSSLIGRYLREHIRIEGAVAVAAAEIAGADLPDDVAAHLRVIGAETALAGVVG